METNFISSLVKNLDLPANIVKVITNAYGLIHKRELVEYEGKQYWLVWDYLAYNEITLEEVETGKQIRMFSSFNDQETEKKYNEIISKLNDLSQEYKNTKKNNFFKK